MHQPVLPAFLIARWLLLLVLLAGIYFLSGFLVPALAALIIGLATWPLFQRLVRAFGGRTTLAATLALVAVIVILVVPLSLALSYAIKEAGNFFAWALAANKHGVDVPAWIMSLPMVESAWPSTGAPTWVSPTPWAPWSRSSAASTWATSTAWCCRPRAMPSSCC